MKNQIVEWVAAVLLIAIIVIVFMFGGILITSLAIVCFLGLVIAATIDMVMAPFRWLSSLFPSTKEKGKGEEESDGSA